jgi:recombination protein RecT
MPGQTIAQATQGRAAQPTVVQLVNQMGPEIQRALPDHLSGERVARLALTAIRLNPALGECKPESLFWQHPNAQSLNAQAVHEKDEFDYAYGLAPKLVHKPAKGDRGPVIYYYAAVSLSTGGQHFEVFTPEEIRELRNGKVGGNGNIADPRRWMERKTAIRQVLKPMPKSVQLSRAVESDERDGGELYMERVAEKAPAALTGPAGVDTASGEVTDQAAAEAAGEAGPTQEVIDAMNRGE